VDFDVMKGGELVKNPFELLDNKKFIL